jgi:murein DD-endopeptidase MepM/ murein hydrolase activator NlpD
MAAVVLLGALVLGLSAALVTAPLVPRPAAAGGNGVLAQVGPGGAPSGAPTVAYRPPVDATVVDRFRPPSTPYGPGNRGWEYATVPGSTVVAAADGVVTFAGPVGGSLAVTVRHADGLRTSCSFLASVVVAEGAVVRAGDPIGSAGARLHFGVRRGDTYLDPAFLFAATGPDGAIPEGPARVRLVPLRR